MTEMPGFIQIQSELSDSRIDLQKPAIVRVNNKTRILNLLNKKEKVPDRCISNSSAKNLKKSLK